MGIADKVKQTHNNDADECINNNVHVSIGGFGGIEGSGGVGSVGSCRCVSSGVVRGQCKSNRGLKSRFRSNANTSNTTNTTSVNDDNMTTTDDDGQRRKHDEPRSTPLEAKKKQKNVSKTF